MSELLTVEFITTAVFAVIGIASALVKIIESITDVHPSDRLDRYAGKGRKAIAWIENILDKLALNPRG
jgi:hypothetical protein